jgi:hypothetical protein
MIDDYFIDESARPGAIADVALIERILQQAARECRSMSYSEILLMLGFRFTRPKMRALCKTLDAVDEQGKARGEPELAALVVREGDRLPGQGWWTGRRDYVGAWTGPEARIYLDAVQGRTFRYWKLRPAD